MQENKVYEQLIKQRIFKYVENQYNQHFYIKYKI